MEVRRAQRHVPMSRACVCPTPEKAVRLSRRTSAALDARYVKEAGQRQARWNVLMSRLTGYLYSANKAVAEARGIDFRSHSWDVSTPYEAACADAEGMMLKLIGKGHVYEELGPEPRR